MNGFDRQRLLTGLILVVMALFVASSVAPAMRWRRPLRLAAITGFFIALALAFTEIALWWSGSTR